MASRALRVLRAFTLLATTAVGWPEASTATVPELVGVGARWQGAGGAGVAVIDDGWAARLNPAGLSREPRSSLGIGAVGGWPQLQAPPPVYWDTNRDGAVDDRDPALQFENNPPAFTGLQVQASRNIGDRFGLGFTAYVPSNVLIRYRTVEPALPQYIRWDNRTQRAAVAVGLAGAVLPGVHAGVGIDLVAKTRVRVAGTVDAVLAAEGDDSLGSELAIDFHEVEITVVPSVAPIVGIQLDLSAWSPAVEVVLGATYRGEVGMPLDATLDVQANAEISDVGDVEPYVAALVAQGEIALFDHYVPPRVDLGIAYRRADLLTLYADARWTDWRRMRISVAQLSAATVTAPLLDLDDSVVDGNPVSYTMRSVWGVHAGAEVELPKILLDNRMMYLAVALRGGFGFEPSPLVAQGATSALLDPGRAIYTVGAGVAFRDPLDWFAGPMFIDLFGQLHTLSQDRLARSTSTPRAGYPVDQGFIDSGGSVPVAGAQWSVQY